MINKHMRLTTSILVLGAACVVMVGATKRSIDAMAVFAFLVLMIAAIQACQEGFFSENRSTPIRDQITRLLAGTYFFVGCVSFIALVIEALIT